MFLQFPPLASMILGQHFADVIVVGTYFTAMLVIGRLMGKSVQGEGDFYLAGRKLGKLLQFFLNFGNMTDANGAASTSSAVYSNGVGGVWLSFQTLFMTPYYWAMNVWFRRARLVTVADLFEDRFGSRLLAGMYAGFNAIFAVSLIGWGYLVSFKTMVAVLVKPDIEWTVQERASVDQFREYIAMKREFVEGKLAVEDMPRFETLQALRDRGAIKAYVSYLEEFPFYLVYALVVGAYTIMGGMAAAVLTDAVQGILMIAFSLILIPFGLAGIGGFGGLQERLEPVTFDLLSDRGFDSSSVPNHP